IQHIALLNRILAKRYSTSRHGNAQVPDHEAFAVFAAPSKEGHADGENLRDDKLLGRKRFGIECFGADRLEARPLGLRGTTRRGCFLLLSWCPWGCRLYQCFQLLPCAPGGFPVVSVPAVRKPW